MKKMLSKTFLLTLGLICAWPVENTTAQITSGIFTDFEINNKFFRPGNSINEWASEKVQWGNFNLIDAQDNAKDVQYKDKEAIHTVVLDGGRKSEDFLMTLRNVSSNKYKRIFKTNFTANIKSKEDIDFLRKLGENGYTYVVELKAGKQTWDIKYTPKELKKLFQWNQ